ncbi:MAG TPA: tRNA (adenosine(37)-N6)-threonylcarbamoyltransferase complex dimerization subunit type 1 TsaB [Thermomicrobiales bacterium]|nr:tRNA (adenosine(37)-N6)-threonylcarbamoyltransferase complex dimerization subunit type 1 TsaB [Thermomicrobiales bacterium]
MSDSSAIGDGRAGDARADQLLLCIDASSEQAGIGVFGRGHAAGLVWRAGRAQTVALLAQIHHLLDLHGLAPADLGAVAVAAGPGTFNGLRVGMSVAKGLVLALDLPLYGIDTLAVAAAPWLLPGTPVIAAVAAGRGRLVWAEYQSGDEPVLAAPPRNTGPDELIAAVRSHPARVIVTGELAADTASALAAHDHVTVPPEPLRARQPGALAWLATCRWTRGAADDPALIEPRYLGR